MIRVVIVDDHTVVRQGLRFLLDQQSDIEVVGEAADGAHAIAIVRDQVPAHGYATGIAACTTQSGGSSGFVDRFFRDNQNPFLGVTAVVLVQPVLIGLFWGAPLITRELEAGTHRLVWNQSINRTRWLAVKLGLTGLAAMTAARLGSGDLVVPSTRPPPTSRGWGPCCSSHAASSLSATRPSPSPSA